MSYSLQDVLSYCFKCYNSMVSLQKLFYLNHVWCVSYFPWEKIENIKEAEAKNIYLSNTLDWVTSTFRKIPPPLYGSTQIIYFLIHKCSTKVCSEFFFLICFSQNKTFFQLLKTEENYHIASIQGLLCMCCT